MKENAYDTDSQVNVESTYSLRVPGDSKMPGTTIISAF